MTSVLVISCTDTAADAVENTVVTASAATATAASAAAAGRHQREIEGREDSSAGKSAARIIESLKVLQGSVNAAHGSAVDTVSAFCVGPASAVVVIVVMIMIVIIVIMAAAAAVVVYVVAACRCTAAAGIVNVGSAVSYESCCAA